MGFTANSKEAIEEDLIAFENGLLPGLVVAPDTDAGVRNKLIVEQQYGVQVELQTVVNNQFPSDKTTTEALDLHGAARVGPRKAASKSTGTITVTGTVGSIAPALTELASKDGVRYQTTAALTLTSTSGTVAVESIDTGVQANRIVGDKLTFSIPPSGVNSTATVLSGFSDALDIETDGEYLARILDAYKNPPAGGRFSDYRQTAEKITGVLRAYPYGPSSLAPTGRRGLGIVDVVITSKGNKASRQPTAAVKQDVIDAIEDMRPNSTKDFSVLIPGLTVVSADVTVTPKVGFEFDWTAASAYTVSAWNSSTLEVTVTPNHASEMAVGDRVLVAGQVATITLVTAPNKFRIDKNLVDPVPAAAHKVRPGGPLSQPVIDSIAAYYAELAPSNVSNAKDPEHDVDDILRPHRIEHAAFEVDGVKDAVMVTPTVNNQPPDSGPTTINIIVYDTITVTPG